MDTSERPNFEKYKALRQDLLDLHLERALGSDVVLNEQENQLNTILMGLKAEEIERGFQNPFNFTPSRHFFDVLKSVESSSLFKLIQKMPKGAFHIKSYARIFQQISHFSLFLLTQAQYFTLTIPPFVSNEF
jgi:Adenosine/AMP deaminase N-terminal